MDDKNSFSDWLDEKIDQLLAVIGIKSCHPCSVKLYESYQQSKVMPLIYWCANCDKVEKVTKHLTCMACNSPHVYPSTRPKNLKYDLIKRIGFCQMEIEERLRLKNSILPFDK